MLFRQVLGHRGTVGMPQFAPDVDLPIDLSEGLEEAAVHTAALASCIGSCAASTTRHAVVQLRVEVGLHRTGDEACLLHAGHRLPKRTVAVQRRLDQFHEHGVIVHLGPFHHIAGVAVQRAGVGHFWFWRGLHILGPHHAALYKEQEQGREQAQV